jgi:hypothetical protein
MTISATHIWLIRRVPCKIYPVKSTQIFFQGGSLKKVGCHAYKSEKNQVSTQKKNLGRFYRVPFKSLLRVQIKQDTEF